MRCVYCMQNIGKCWVRRERLDTFKKKGSYAANERAIMRKLVFKEMWDYSVKIVVIEDGLESGNIKFGRCRAQMSQPRRGPWRYQQLPTPVEGRPPVCDITAEECEECRAPGRSPPRLMVFQGPEVTKRRTKEVPLHIYVLPFCLLAAAGLESRWGDLFA